MGCGMSSASKVEAESADIFTAAGGSREAPTRNLGEVMIPAASEKTELDFQRSERISWRKGDLIGAGANGRVYLGLEEDTGAIIAVKEIVFTSDEWIQRPLSKISHRYIFSKGKIWRNSLRCKRR